MVFLGDVSRISVGADIHYGRRLFLSPELQMSKCSEICIYGHYNRLILDRQHRQLSVILGWQKHHHAAHLLSVFHHFSSLFEMLIC